MSAVGFPREVSGPPPGQPRQASNQPLPGQPRQASNQPLPGQPRVVIGPSAAGKSTLAGAFVATRPDYQLVLTHTTRPSRPGESGSHIFVSDQEFDQTDFLGTLKIFGWRYGLPAWQGTATPLLVLRQGALDQFGALFSRFKVIQVEAPVEVLMARLARRETSLNSAGQAASEGSNRADPAALSTEIALGRRAAGRIVSTDQPFAQALAEFSQALADA